MAIALKLDEAGRLGRERRFTDTRAREAIADIYRIANADNLPTATAAEYLASWVKIKELEVSERSIADYHKAAKDFVEALGARAGIPVDAVTTREVLAFREALAQRVSAGTVNKYLLILRGAWSAAIRSGHARENIFARVGTIKDKKSDRIMRRAFTLPEMRRVLDKCCDDWRGAVLVGFYTGQRLQDVANLSWKAIDYAASNGKGEIYFVTRKTGKPLALPIAEPLRRYLLDRPSSDDPDAVLFPTLAGEPSNVLARRFSEILMEAGLVAQQDHQGTGKGRDCRRKSRGLSFHCLRHTATSLLKNAGASDVVAREIVGHDSEEVSRVYTHIETDTLRKAVDAMPDLLAGVKE